jgi:hypothetical protein
MLIYIILFCHICMKCFYSVRFYIYTQDSHPFNSSLNYLNDDILSKLLNYKKQRLLRRVKLNLINKFVLIF